MKVKKLTQATVRVTCLIIEYIMRRIEKKLDYYHD